MFVMVMYVPGAVIDSLKRKAVADKAQEMLCQGFKVPAKDVKIILECVEKENCNPRVGDVFFPILYMPEGTPYEAKKRAGRLLHQGLLSLFPEGEMKNVYLHMKEHGLDNYSVNGESAFFDTELKKEIIQMKNQASEGE